MLHGEAQRGSTDDRSVRDAGRSSLKAKNTVLATSDVAAAFSSTQHSIGASDETMKVRTNGSGTSANEFRFAAKDLLVKEGIHWRLYLATKPV